MTRPPRPPTAPPRAPREGAEPSARNTSADYYRHDGVTIRVSTHFRDVPPVCLTCRSNACPHVEEFLKHSTQHVNAA
jgi:hypothetical protein